MTDMENRLLNSTRQDLRAIQAQLVVLADQLDDDPGATCRTLALWIDGLRRNMAITLGEANARDHAVDPIEWEPPDAQAEAEADGSDPV